MMSHWNDLSSIHMYVDSHIISQFELHGWSLLLLLLLYEGLLVHSTHNHNDVLTTHHQKMILSASSFSPILLRAACSTDHDGTPF